MNQPIASLLQGIIEGSNDLILALDMNYRIVVANQAYLQSFERTFQIKAAIGANLFELLAPWPRVQEIGRQLWKRAIGGEKFVQIHPFQQGDQTIFYELSHTPICTPDGVQIGAVQVAHDITRRIRAQEQLQQLNQDLEVRVAQRTAELEERNQQLHNELEERQRIEAELSQERELLQKLFDRIPVMLTIYDPEINMLRVNNEFERLIGWSSEELRTVDVMAVCYPDPEYRKEVGDFMQSLESGWRHFSVTTKNGDTVESYWSNILLSNQTQVGIGIDLTARKQAEQALHESENRLRQSEEQLLLALEGAQLGVFDINLITGETFWDARCRQIFGVSQDEAATIEKGFRIVHPDDRPLAEQAFERAKDPTSTGVYQVEERVIWPDGTIRWIITKGKVQYETRHDNRTPIRLVGIVMDNTLHRQADDALRQSEERLRLLNESLEAQVAKRTQQVQSLSKALTLAEQRERRHLSRVLHEDLQQLLFGLEMKLYSLQQLSATINQTIAENIEGVRALTKQAVHLTRTLSIELNPPVLRGDGLSIALGWLSRHMEEMYKLHVTLEIQDPVVVQSEDMRVLLVQFVRELLLNVAKHAQVDRASVTITEENDHIRICVEDTGKGFDVEVARRNRTHYDTFGLFTVEERLRMFGGELIVESTPGQGSRLTILAPFIASSTPLLEGQ